MTSESAEWGLFPWFEEHGIGHVHPEDIDGLRELGPYARLFRVVGTAGEFTILAYGDRRFRVKRDLFEPVPTPTFQFGDPVKFTKGGSIVRGVVSDIGWHFVRSEPIYLVTLGIGKKPLSKRYFRTDLTRDG